MSILAKVNDDNILDLENKDFTMRLKEGIQQGLDVNSMLLQYQYFKKIEREDINACGINTERAKKRCESVYHDCEEINYNEIMGISDDEAVSILFL